MAGGAQQSDACLVGGRCTSSMCVSTVGEVAVRPVDRPAVARAAASETGSGVRLQVGAVKSRRPGGWPGAGAGLAEGREPR